MEHGVEKFLMIPNELYGLTGDYDVDGEKVNVSLIGINLLAKIIEFDRNGIPLFASNDYFTDFFGVHRNSINNAIKALKKLGFIEIHDSQRSGKGIGRNTNKRYILFIDTKTKYHKLKTSWHNNCAELL